MRSNTAREGCDPAGTFSPAGPLRPPFSFRRLAAAAFLVGLVGGFVALVLR